MIPFSVKNIILVVILFASSSLIFFTSKNVFAKFDSEVKCTSTYVKLVYDCIIFLKDMKTKNKISGAKFMVSADMPSMPGAHNVKPVMAHSMGSGIYHFRLNLEMYGEWVLKMDFSKPKRDRILKKITFGGKLNKKSHKNSAKHNHKKRDLESHQNHAAENKH